MTTNEPKKRRTARPQTTYKNVEAAMARLDVSSMDTVQDLLDALKNEWFKQAT